MLKDIAYCIEDNLHDPVYRAMMRNGCFLRTYQAEALRTIYDAVVFRRGGKFAVTFPRQSGKNETQAQLEAAVMAASLYRGGSIIKIMPTEKNQGRVSTERVIRALSFSGAAMGSMGDPYGGNFSDPAPAMVPNIWTRAVKHNRNGIFYGSTTLRCLSASPNAAIVGATADLLLEVDEAQMVTAEKYDREAAPMAASTNAVRVFWGTAWDDQTLLSRETRLGRLNEEADGTKHIFMTTAAEVGKEVPAYGDFVRSQVESMGREHPAIRTQYFCEEISDLTAMFTPERIGLMMGDHEPLWEPDPEACYVFLIDIAGSDEATPRERQKEGFSDRRDSTVLTICDVSLPENEDYDPRNFLWKVVGRRLYRNLPSADLEELITREVEHWDPAKIILDHSGLGAMLSGYLSAKYPNRCVPVDITASAKTKMAWDFLAMVNSGHWKEYRADELSVRPSDYRPGRDHFEVLEDPALLRQMFLRELRACRIEPTGNGMTVRWGVMEALKDHATGRILHDDLVMSAALAVFENGDLPLRNTLPEWIEPVVFNPWR